MGVSAYGRVVGKPEIGHHFWVLTNYRNDVTVKMRYKQ